jgi:hypothetical protein
MLSPAATARGAAMQVPVTTTRPSVVAKEKPWSAGRHTKWKRVPVTWTWKGPASKRHRPALKPGWAMATSMAPLSTSTRAPRPSVASTRARPPRWRTKELPSEKCTGTGRAAGASMRSPGRPDVGAEPTWKVMGRDVQSTMPRASAEAVVTLASANLQPRNWGLCNRSRRDAFRAATSSRNPTRAWRITSSGLE